MSTFTPSANRALNRHEPYSRPTQEIADQLLVPRYHSLLASTNIILDNEDPNNNKSRNRNAF